jgi:hypothetical protein
VTEFEQRLIAIAKRELNVSIYEAALRLVESVTRSGEIDAPMTAFRDDIRKALLVHESENAQPVGLLLN